METKGSIILDDTIRELFMNTDVRLGEYIVTLVPAKFPLGCDEGNPFELEVGVFGVSLDIPKCSIDGPEEMVADVFTLRIGI